MATPVLGAAAFGLAGVEAFFAGVLAGVLAGVFAMTSGLKCFDVSKLRAFAGEDKQLIYKFYATE